MTTADSLTAAASSLAALLRQRNTRIAFAESCTAGLVCAALAQTPGISQWLCGSAVTYRESTKTDWLAIPPSEIQSHGVVSAAIARQMAAGVLRYTPEAEVAAAITGHLGPHAPRELDGVVFMAFTRRHDDGVEIFAAERFKLESTIRSERQQEAAARLLQFVYETLDRQPP